VRAREEGVLWTVLRGRGTEPPPFPRPATILLAHCATADGHLVTPPATHVYNLTALQAWDAAIVSNASCLLLASRTDMAGGSGPWMAVVRPLPDATSPAGLQRLMSLTGVVGLTGSGNFTSFCDVHANQCSREVGIGIEQAPATHINTVASDFFPAHATFEVTLPVGSPCTAAQGYFEIRGWGWPDSAVQWPRTLISGPVDPASPADAHTIVFGDAAAAAGTQRCFTALAVTG